MNLPRVPGGTLDRGGLTPVRCELTSYDRANAVASTTLQVPYVTAYSDKHIQLDIALEAAADGLRLTYAQPDPADWMLGVLWPRLNPRHDGHPRFKEMHALRQRECMLERRCQVCHGTAVSPSGRLSWLLPMRIRPSQVCTSKPPVCLGCIPETLDTCPRLHDHAYVYSSSDYEPRGVIGRVLTGVEMEKHEVPLTDKAALRLTIALGLIVRVLDLRPEPLPGQ